MLTNPGFSFTGVSGEHMLVPTMQTDLKVWGPLYQEVIVCTYDGELVKVYDNGPGFNYTDESVAMKFAAIDINDTNAIIRFCNKYGMPYSSRQFGNHKNDYIFFSSDKDEFSRVIPVSGRRERAWLYSFQRDIVFMRLAIDLNQAIQDRNYVRICEIMLFFCFDLHGLDFEGSERKTETFQFNHYFFRFAEDNGYYKGMELSDKEQNELITGFLYDIDASYQESEWLDSMQVPHQEKYTQIHYSMWQHLYHWFSVITKETKVTNISPYGEVTFSSLLNNAQIIDSNDDADNLLKTARGVFTDLFKENLHRVYPEMVFNKNGEPESSWRIPTLIDAMYLELFFRFTPSSSVRKCMNPTCPKFFVRTSSRPSKIYCDENCAKLMAKRMERERKRKQKRESD